MLRCFRCLHGVVLWLVVCYAFLMFFSCQCIAFFCVRLGVIMLFTIASAPLFHVLFVCRVALLFYALLFYALLFQLFA